ncbi:MAG: acetylxylan esterase [Candidatus Glassbacteria bacterium RIFCSPLOWO2_12_FULL_58_11]|uniref:Acetylxylan esterase n=1 Tax=Candidatus Glassbacteria bacterium RIFCSPLOWO2_12_FULL_58_11 TaxID=1817867 RepID=A0A1F5Z2F5_9BACT|nr:MAG: acetylxylan esterase [Candidatus Glassbacteria bacterium RIFCSPLOWO2_12_FULL_58_11]
MKMSRTLSVISLIPALCLGLSTLLLRGQEFTPNFDESKVPAYTLPNPLLCLDGTRVSGSTQWFEKRRPEIMGLFQEQVYGKSPGKPGKATYASLDSSLALEGTAIRKQVELTLQQGGKEITIGLLLYLPSGRSGPVPAFLGLNFGGNHSICSDPGIILNTNWMRPNEKNGIVNNQATEASRGSASSRWDIPAILGRGYALATAYYGDIDPDFDDGFRNGVHPLFYKAGQIKPAADEWGSIGAWAWGLSRILDYLETDSQIDARRVIVMGHSRLGKTALWAGAQDERFAMVVSNNSGCGGATLSMRCFGETVGAINTSFPHWFCANFRQYNEHEERLPVDQHMLLALIAPRPVYVASAEEDRWADPRGEYLSLKGAEPVYRLLGAEGLAGEEMPAVDQPLNGRLGYHIRSGGHAVTPYDWKQYLAWADLYLPKR